MYCRLCNSEAEEKFTARILNKYNVKYYHCKNCFLLQTEEPHWLDEAYIEPINLTDTGLLKRNILFKDKTKVILYYLFNSKAKFLDYAGGYGVFTRLMRDDGFDFYWSDPYTQNLFAKGFEFNNDDKIELITSFESFEHFVKPLEEIEKMLTISKNIFFSTNIVPKPIPAPENWWYYALEHGQHVSFYSRETFEFIAKELNLNYYSYGKTLHLLTEKKINKRYYNFLFKHINYFKKNVDKKMMSKTEIDSKLLSKI